MGQAATQSKVWVQIGQRRQTDSNLRAQGNALVSGQGCVKKHLGAGPRLRGESAVTNRWRLPGAPAGRKVEGGRCYAASWSGNP